MATAVGLVRAASNTSTGTQDFRDANMTATPNAALFIVSYATTDGTAIDEARFSLGACDATDEWAAWISVDHNADTTNSNSELRTTACVALETVASGDFAVAAFDSFLADAGSGAGVRINWTTAPATGVLVTVVLFSCNNAKVGTFTNTTVDNTTQVTPGFASDAIFLSTPKDFGTTGAFSFGVCDASLNQYAIGWNDRDNRATTELLMTSRNNRAVMHEHHFSTERWAIEITAIGATTFDATTRNNDGNGGTIGYLALDTDTESVWVGNVTIPTSTGNAAVTAPAFTPQFVLGALSLAEAHETQYSDSRAGSTGLRVFTANAEFSTVISSEDNVGVSNAQSLADNVSLQLPDDDGTLVATATFVSFDANGWTENVSLAPATAKTLWALAIEAVSGGGGGQTINANLISSTATLYQPTVTTGAVTVSPNLIASTLTIYQPAVTTGAVTISAERIESASILYQPSITVGAVTIAPNLLASTATVYQPTVTVGAATISPDLLTSTATVYEPTVVVGAVTISLNAIASSATVYEPTVTLGGVTVAPNLIASTATVYEPTVTPGAVSIAPDLLASTAEVFAPTVSSGLIIQANFLASTATVYAPTITTGAVTVSPNLLASAAQVFDPTVVPGAVTISPNAIASGATVYEPTVTLGGVTIRPDLIVSTATVYAPTITTGAVSIAPNLIASTATIYAPTVANVSTQTINASFLSSGAVVYQVIVSLITISAERTFTVAAEDRTLAVEAEDRTFLVAVESRTFSVT